MSVKRESDGLLLFLPEGGTEGQKYRMGEICHHFNSVDTINRELGECDKLPV